MTLFHVPYSNPGTVPFSKTNKKRFGTYVSYLKLVPFHSRIARDGHCFHYHLFLFLFLSVTESRLLLALTHFTGPSGKEDVLFCDAANACTTDPLTVRELRPAQHGTNCPLRLRLGPNPCCYSISYANHKLGFFEAFSSRMRARRS